MRAARRRCARARHLPLQNAVQRRVGDVEQNDHRAKNVLDVGHRAKLDAKIAQRQRALLDVQQNALAVARRRLDVDRIVVVVVVVDVCEAAVSRRLCRLHAKSVDLQSPIVRRNTKRVTIVDTIDRRAQSSARSWSPSRLVFKRSTERRPMRCKKAARASRRVG